MEFFRNKRNLVMSVLTAGVLIWAAYLVIYNEPKQSSVTNKPNDVESFLKDSAQEIANPGQGSTQPNNSTTNPNSGTVESACIDQQSNDFDCYDKYYKNLVSTKGVAAAFADLKQRYSTSSYIQSQCHPITHVIGNEAAIIYADVGKAYTVGDSFCWSGYYHGVMEGIIGKTSREDLPKQINTVCNSIPGKASYNFDYYNCVHGLGHGVMAITQDELFESLSMCDNLTGGWEQSSCYGGVYMENVIVDNKNHFTKYLKPSEPLYPCTAVADKYKATCYLMQTSYMLKVTNSDFSKVFELCSSVGNYAAICYQSLGRDASGRSISNAEITKTTCYLGKDYEQRSNCIIGAVKDFVSYYHSDQQAKGLCAILTKDLQDVCYPTVESYYQNF